MSSSGSETRSGDAAAVLTVSVKKATEDDEVFFKVKPSTTMAKLFHSYAYHRNLVLSTLVFKAGDVVVGQDDTPAALGFKDGQVIVCEQQRKFAPFEPAHATHADVSFLVDGHVFRMHKYPVLKTGSPLLESLLEDDTSDEGPLPLSIPGGAEVFDIVARFCYKDEVNVATLVTADNVAQVRVAASYLQMSGLQALADKFLSRKVDQDPQKALRVLLSAQSVAGASAPENAVVQRCAKAIARGVSWRRLVGAFEEEAAAIEAGRRDEIHREQFDLKHKSRPQDLGGEEEEEEEEGEREGAGGAAASGEDSSWRGAAGSGSTGNGLLSLGTGDATGAAARLPPAVFFLLAQEARTRLRASGDAGAEQGGRKELDLTSGRTAGSTSGSGRQASGEGGVPDSSSEDDEDGPASGSSRETGRAKAERRLVRLGRAVLAYVRVRLLAHARRSALLKTGDTTGESAGKVASGWLGDGFLREGEAAGVQAPHGYLQQAGSRPHEVSDLLPLLDTQSMPIPDCLAVLHACSRCVGPGSGEVAAEARTAGAGAAESTAGDDPTNKSRQRRAAAALERYEALKRRAAELDGGDAAPSNATAAAAGSDSESHSKERTKPADEVSSKADQLDEIAAADVRALCTFVLAARPEEALGLEQQELSQLPPPMVGQVLQHTTAPFAVRRQLLALYLLARTSSDSPRSSPGGGSPTDGGAARPFTGADELTADAFHELLQSAYPHFGSDASAEDPPGGGTARWTRKDIEEDDSDGDGGAGFYETVLSVLAWVVDEKLQRQMDGQELRDSLESRLDDMQKQQLVRLERIAPPALHRYLDDRKWPARPFALAVLEQNRVMTLSLAQAQQTAAALAQQLQQERQRAVCNHTHLPVGTIVRVHRSSGREELGKVAAYSSNLRLHAIRYMQAGGDEASARSVTVAGESSREGKQPGKDDRRWYDLQRTAFRVEALPKMRGLQQSTVDTAMRPAGRGPSVGSTSPSRVASAGGRTRGNQGAHTNASMPLDLTNEAVQSARRARGGDKGLSAVPKLPIVRHPGGESANAGAGEARASAAAQEAVQEQLQLLDMSARDNQRPPPRSRAGYRGDGTSSAGRSSRSVSHASDSDDQRPRSMAASPDRRRWVDGDGDWQRLSMAGGGDTDTPVAGDATDAAHAAARTSAAMQGGLVGMRPGGHAGAGAGSAREGGAGPGPRSGSGSQRQSGASGSQRGGQASERSSRASSPLERRPRQSHQRGETKRGRGGAIGIGRARPNWLSDSGQGGGYHNPLAGPARPHGSKDGPGGKPPASGGKRASATKSKKRKSKVATHGQHSHGRRGAGGPGAPRQSAVSVGALPDPAILATSDLAALRAMNSAAAQAANGRPGFAVGAGARARASATGAGRGVDAQQGEALARALAQAEAAAQTFEAARSRDARRGIAGVGNNARPAGIGEARSAADPDESPLRRAGGVLSKSGGASQST